MHFPFLYRIDCNNVLFHIDFLSVSDLVNHHRESSTLMEERGDGGGDMRRDRFDLSLKFIIESVSRTEKRTAGYEDQPNALLMRHSETHIHTQIHTRCSHYVQICGLRPPGPVPPHPPPA